MIVYIFSDNEKRLIVYIDDNHEIVIVYIRYNNDIYNDSPMAVYTNN